MKGLQQFGIKGTKVECKQRTNSHYNKVLMELKELKQNVNFSLLSACVFNGGELKELKQNVNVRNTRKMIDGLIELKELKQNVNVHGNYLTVMQQKRIKGTKVECKSKLFTSSNLFSTWN